MSRVARNTLVGFVLFTALNSAFAVDGVTLIDQNRALAGGVTPGDTPGFPVIISAPGIYKLATNLVVPDQNTTAIRINVPNVTIDLNGFAILGPNVCATDGFNVAQPCTLPGTGNGIESAQTNVRVLNGSIDGLGGVSIFTGTNTRIEKMNISNCGGIGIQNNGGVILDTLVRGCGSHGIVTTGAIIRESRAIFNRGVGMATSNVSIVNNNVAAVNQSVGFSFSANTRYTDNVVDNNNGGNGNQQIAGGTSAGTNTCGTAAC